MPAKGYRYVPEYYAPSAHKQVDIRTLTPFGPLAKAVIDAKRTYHQYDRLYSIFEAITNLARHFPSTEAINLAEVGVYKGGSSAFIAATCQALGLTKATVHCFDTFTGFPDDSFNASFDAARQATELFRDVELEDVQEYLSRFSNVHIYDGRFEETSDAVTDQNFAFAHVDVDLYEATYFALRFFHERLLPGGIIIVDDYGFLTCPGVQQAVDRFVSETPERDYSTLRLLAGQYMLLRNLPLPDEPAHQLANGHEGAGWRGRYESLLAAQSALVSRLEELECARQSLLAEIDALEAAREQSEHGYRERLASIDAESQRSMATIQDLTTQLGAMAALQARLAAVEQEAQVRLENTRTLEQRLMVVQADADERLSRLRELASEVEALKTQRDEHARESARRGEQIKELQALEDARKSRGWLRRTPWPGSKPR